MRGMRNSISMIILMEDGFTSGFCCVVLFYPVHSKFCLSWVFPRSFVGELEERKVGCGVLIVLLGYCAGCICDVLLWDLAVFLECLALTGQGVLVVISEWWSLLVILMLNIITSMIVAPPGAL